MGELRSTEIHRPKVHVHQDNCFINVCTFLCSEILEDDVQPEELSDEQVDENEDLVNDGAHVLDEDDDEDV